jgi:hypothetical protein
MTGKRIPKQGEVWTFDGSPRTVWAADRDHVAVEDENGKRFIPTTDSFMIQYTPPEPTVKRTVYLRTTDDGEIFFASSRLSPTHRIEVLTDGTVRLVKVDG